MLDKVLSNMAEVRARGAHVIAVATEGSAQVAEHAEEVVEVPRTDWLLQPMLAVIHFSCWRTTSPARAA